MKEEKKTDLELWFIWRFICWIIFMWIIVWLIIWIIILFKEYTLYSIICVIIIWGLGIALDKDWFPMK